MTCHIDGKDARCGLCHYHNVHKFLFVHPLMAVDKLSLHNRNHGIATAQGKGSNLITRNKKTE